MELRNFWAKTSPYQSVVTHGIVTGTVCRCLIQSFLSESARAYVFDAFAMDSEYAEALICYLVSLHDIGKIEYHFQSKEPGMAEQLKREKTGDIAFGKVNVRHEATGRKVIRGIWHSMDLDEDAVDVFSNIIGAHHQKNTSSMEGKPSRYFLNYQKELEEEMRRVFLGEKRLIIPELTEEDGVLESILLGLMILSDWIASGVMFADAEQWIDNADAEEHIHRLTCEFLNKSGIGPRKHIWRAGFSNVWPWISHDSLRPPQKCIEQRYTEPARDLVTLIEAPMGEGKTEAGMYAAVQLAKTWRKDGFYVALPTAATSSQMVSRIRDWFGVHNLDDRIRLLHGMAWLSDEAMVIPTNSEDASEILNWLVPTRRALLGQYSVGTVDQAMLAISKTRYGVLRLLGLANKVLVIDEIHSYDVYMGAFLVRLLEWCRAMKTPVIMLSATLPPDLKKKLLKPYTNQKLSGAYPLITSIDDKGVVHEQVIGETSRKQNVEIHLLPILNAPEMIASKAKELTEHGGCICVMMNTVMQAQQVYRELEKMYDGELYLFHAQFPAARRDEIEKECISKFGKDKSNRPHRAILVSTQVVEQSLDVDFDAMLTAAAPIDLLIQRMGRIFRHEETVRPETMQHPVQWIMIPSGDDFGADGFVYPEVLLKQSIHILKDRSTVRIPEDLAELVADGYDETKVPAEEANNWLEKKLEDSIIAGKSQQYLMNPPDKTLSAITGDILLEDSDSDYLAVKTRLGEPTVRIALLEPELYAEIEQKTVIRNGMRVAQIQSSTLARKVMEQSVAVRKKRMRFIRDDLLYINGDKLLSGVRMFPAENGIWECDDGKILFDRKLGVSIEEGKR